MSKRNEMVERAQAAGFTVVDEGTERTQAPEAEVAAGQRSGAWRDDTTAKRAGGFSIAGCRARRHPQTGTLVYMKKDDPGGGYFDRRGRRLPEVMARQAGHDVEGAKAQAHRQQRRARALERIERLLGPADNE